MAEAFTGETVVVFGDQRVASAISNEPGVIYLDTMRSEERRIGKECRL